MKFSPAVVLTLILFAAASAQAIVPTLDLEVKIAYQQGQFGGLYAQCGSRDEKVVIGGSLENWRMETLRGYKGSPQERTQLEKAFDTAASAVAADPAACQDWIKAAGTTWRSIVQLVQYGGPVASKR